MTAIAQAQWQQAQCTIYDATENQAPLPAQAAAAAQASREQLLRLAFWADKARCAAQRNSDSVGHGGTGHSPIFWARSYSTPSLCCTPFALFTILSPAHLATNNNADATLHTRAYTSVQRAH